MARANRHYEPGLVWHITHRCHKKEFLLKFSKDRKEWKTWLYEARKRFGLVVLDYIATSNHIHLLVYDRAGADVIPRGVQLAAGRTAQSYNRRKNRKGAFWEDRYHATAVQSGDHLIRCIVCIDLNMVRAGAVRHPEEWPDGGYGEIQAPPKRYRVVDRAALRGLLGIEDDRELSLAHRKWVDQGLSSTAMRRQSQWSESIAVGNPAFLEGVKARLGARAAGRKIMDGEACHQLKEPLGAYEGHFPPKMEALSHKNMLIWDPMAYESAT